MKKRIGLTGGTGFIGQYLIKDFGDQFDFVAITSKPDSSAFCSKALYVHSQYNAEGYSRAFQGCEAIVHLGASIPDQVTDLGNMEEYCGNILSSEQLFRACGALGIKKLINISSVSAYNKKKEMPLKETMPSEPDNCYGLSKVAVEMLADMYGKKFDFTVLSLRISQVLGYLKGRNNGFFSMLLNNSCEGKEITIFGEGKASRDYIYVRDVSRAIVAALVSDAPSGIYNIGAGYPTSNEKLAQAFIEGTASESKLIHIDVANEDDRFWYMDTAKASHLLGFEPKYDLEDMAKDMKQQMEIS